MRSLIPVLMFLAACTPPTPTVQGRASVIDGDTLEIHGQRIRLWGMDAPEARQTCEDAGGATYPCGRLAAHRLDERLRDRVVACFEEDIDRYGRMVARCEADGEDIGGWLVREGQRCVTPDTPGRPIWTRRPPLAAMASVSGLVGSAIRKTGAASDGIGREAHPPTIGIGRSATGWSGRWSSVFWPHA